MKPRSFRLAPILRLRERQRDAARQRLGAIVAERDAARAEGRRLTDAASLAGRELFARLERGADSALLQAAGRAGEARHVAGRLAARRADALEAKVTSARSALLDAEREVRGLEILEERSRQLELARRARAEARFLDELGCRRKQELGA